MTYLEPFFGSGAVFFNKKPSSLETINDIDGNVINLFKIIRDQADELAFAIKHTPWARDEYYASLEATEDDTERARRLLVRCWMGVQARTSRVSGFANEINADGAKSCPKLWQAVPERILAIVDRLRDAQIENQEAIKIIERYNFKNVLIYADPPYIQETRSAGTMYAHEMTISQHEELLEALKRHKGCAVLSGYPTKAYDSILRDWTKITTSANAGSRGRSMKGAMEVLWLNPNAAASLSKMNLFDGMVENAE